jgi:short-subunit dehydrogenase
MNKIILISGGSDGIGKAIATTLSSNNTVIILANDEDSLKQTSTELNCEYEVADVSDYSQCENAVKNILQKHVKIDCLVNCAGIWIEGELETNDPTRIKKVIEVNTIGTINLTRCVIPSMKASKGGTIINIISQGGIVAKEERTVYYASKWAITGFTKSLEHELSKYGIRVTGVYPGKVITKMYQKVGIDKDFSNSIEAKDVAKAIEFVVNLDDTVVVPELGIKHING